jgi:hypothetical protein
MTSTEARWRRMHMLPEPRRYKPRPNAQAHLYGAVGLLAGLILGLLLANHI